jgi:hypothetical protein
MKHSLTTMLRLMTTLLLMILRKLFRTMKRLTVSNDSENSDEYAESFCYSGGAVLYEGDQQYKMCPGDFKRSAETDLQKRQMGRRGGLCH